MKKHLLALAAGLIIAFGLVACSGGQEAPSSPTTDAPATDEPTGGDTDSWDLGNLLGNPDPTLAALMDRLVAGVPDVPATENWELTPANAQSFIFIDMPAGSKGIVSQAMINVIPHAVVLLELPAGADAAAVAAQIKANADPSKWICVSAEKLGVFSQGQYVVMVMSYTTVVDGIQANIPSVLG